MPRLYSSTRDLHLYFGLFLSPFLLIFAISTLRLNHPSTASRPAESARRAVAIDPPADPGSVAGAKAILRQAGVTGEIDYIRHNAKAERLLIPVSKPGETIKVEVDLRAKVATVEQQPRGFIDALIFLHRMPGPHNANVRGNWRPMVAWAVTADTVVYGILFLTATGLYLWWMLRSERTTGWLLIGGGTLTVATLVIALSAG
jgi:hypothetical protein